eukprot:gene10926-biopygen8070
MAQSKAAVHFPAFFVRCQCRPLELMLTARLHVTSQEPTGQQRMLGKYDKSSSTGMIMYRIIKYRNFPRLRRSTAVGVGARGGLLGCLAGYEGVPEGPGSDCGRALEGESNNPGASMPDAYSS